MNELFQPAYVALFVAAVLILVLVVLVKKSRSLAVVSAARAEELSAAFQSMKKSQAQVIHTTKMKSLNNLVAGVAHEINTPLGFVGSNVEVVRDLITEFCKTQKDYESAVDLLVRAGSNPAAAQKAKAAMESAKSGRTDQTLMNDAFALLQDCSEGIGQIASIVGNLKSFSRVDRDGQDVMDINEGIESALKMAKQYLRGIEVTRKLGSVSKIKAMASQLNQVFLNIITNAAQAMAGNGKLLVSSKEKDGWLEIVFADSGPGIPDDVMPNIFDPFYTTKDVGDGTGLGLSIAYKIVQGHGGEIMARSVSGRGTYFTIRLPVSNKATRAR